MSLVDEDERSVSEPRITDNSKMACVAIRFVVPSERTSAGVKCLMHARHKTIREPDSALDLSSEMLLLAYF